MVHGEQMAGDEKGENCDVEREAVLRRLEGGGGSPDTDGIRRENVLAELGGTLVHDQAKWLERRRKAGL